MSLNQSKNVHRNPDHEVISEDISSSFNFSPKVKSHSGTVKSISDSAYNSMVCSPLSPPCVAMSQNTVSPSYHDHFPVLQERISPLNEFNDTDEVFQVSFEHIPTPGSTGGDSYLDNNVTFRPISIDQETTRSHSLSDAVSSPILIQRCHRRSSLTSQRSISTQTKFSMGPSAMYRPSSAPLYEGLEEELDDINIDGVVSSNYGIHRNYTCHCIRSPMPDLIQPTIQSNNQLFADQLSLVADQFDNRINYRTHRTSSNNRTRRYSTSSIADMTPGGSFFDFLYSIYIAFDITLPRRRQRRQGPVSFSYDQ